MKLQKQHETIRSKFTCDKNTPLDKLTELLKNLEVYFCSAWLQYHGKNLNVIPVHAKLKLFLLSDMEIIKASFLKTTWKYLTFIA